MKTCSEYRAMARETLRGRWNEMALIMLVLFVISGVFSAPSSIASIFEMPWLSMSLSGLNSCLVLLLIVPLEYALYNLLLSFARNEEFEGSYAMYICRDFAAHWEKYVGSGLLMGILVCLIAIPTLLIGAIILGLAYSLIPYIIRDNPEMSIRDVLRTSRMMMRGHKWELFVLQLSFIGWYLLAILTLCIGLLWLTPYVGQAMAHFYEDVKAEYEAKEDAEVIPAE